MRPFSSIANLTTDKEIKQFEDGYLKKYKSCVSCYNLIVEDWQQTKNKKEYIFVGYECSKCKLKYR